MKHLLTLNGLAKKYLFEKNGDVHNLFIWIFLDDDDCQMRRDNDDFLYFGDFEMMMMMIDDI